MSKITKIDKTPINDLPLGSYNMILRHKLIVTPTQKFIEMTYSPIGTKIYGALKQRVLIEDNSKPEGGDPDVNPGA